MKTLQLGKFNRAFLFSAVLISHPLAWAGTNDLNALSEERARVLESAQSCRALDPRSYQAIERLMQYEKRSSALALDAVNKGVLALDPKDFSIRTSLAYQALPPTAVGVVGMGATVAAYPGVTSTVTGVAGIGLVAGTAAGFKISRMIDEEQINHALEGIGEKDLEVFNSELRKNSAALRTALDKKDEKASKSAVGQVLLGFSKAHRIVQNEVDTAVGIDRKSDAPLFDFAQRGALAAATKGEQMHAKLYLAESKAARMLAASLAADCETQLNTKIGLSSPSAAVQVSEAANSHKIEPAAGSAANQNAESAAGLAK